MRSAALFGGRRSSPTGLLLKEPPVGLEVARPAWSSSRGASLTVTLKSGSHWLDAGVVLSVLRPKVGGARKLPTDECCCHTDPDSGNSFNWVETCVL